MGQNDVIKCGRMGAPITGGAKMPRYYTLNWESQKLKVSLRPKGRGGLLRKCVPYLSGGVLNLEMRVNSRSDTAQQYEYSWQLQELLPDKTYRVLEARKGTFKTKPLNMTKVGLDTYLIQHSGEYHLILTLKRADRQGEPMTQTLFNFKAPARDAVYIGLFLTLLSSIFGIIGIIIGALLVLWTDC